MSKYQGKQQSTALAVIDEQELEGLETFSKEGRSPHLPPGCDILKFNGQEGDWVAPKVDPDERLNGEKFLADIFRVHHGWTRWQGNKRTENHIMPASQKPPKRDTLGDLDESRWAKDDQGKPIDPWQFAVYLLLISDDENFVFITGSQSGQRAVRALVGTAINHDAPARNQIPIVKLGEESFKSRYGSKLYAPIFEIQGWHEIERDADGVIVDFEPIKVRPKQTVLPPEKRSKAAGHPTRYGHETHFDVEEDLDDAPPRKSARHDVEIDRARPKARPSRGRD
jgi:hypothetical protein